MIKKNLRDQCSSGLFNDEVNQQPTAVISSSGHNIMLIVMLIHNYVLNTMAAFLLGLYNIYKCVITYQYSTVYCNNMYIALKSVQISKYKV